jgi:DNA-binding response OmpR family regulator
MKKILIVEDDTFLKNLAAKKLTSEGYEVTTAGNADEASNAIDKETPDLVLLDLLFPGNTDGFGILKKIRENIVLQETPVIIFSNLSDEEDVRKARELGATDYMIKSNFTLDELTEKIKTLIP